jgi:hypothetical protein
MSQGLHLAALSARESFAAGVLPAGPLRYPPIGADQHVDALRTEDLVAHGERFGERPSATGSSASVLLGMLEEVGLTGHGGGHFPVARKWRTALRAGGGGILVVNAAESEPGSAKDRALLATVPHLVLDGLACAGEVLGAQECVIWLHEDARDARRAVSQAIAERHNAGLHELPVRQELAPDRYLSGESSALLQALSGRPALPSFRVGPAAESGYRGRPAVIHNVETFARIALLARTGVRGYPPTTLVTVNTEVGRTVLEVTRSTPEDGGDQTRKPCWWAATAEVGCRGRPRCAADYAKAISAWRVPASARVCCCPCAPRSAGLPGPLK